MLARSGISCRWRARRRARTSCWPGSHPAARPPGRRVPDRSRAAGCDPGQHDVRARRRARHRQLIPDRASMTDPQTSYVEAERPPYLLAGLVALGALVLYVLTLAPTTQFWDTSEYIAAAQVLGIPHPPGNPLFVLIAHTWGLLPPAAGYAMRINLLAAFTSAIAAGCWFLVSERW